MYRCEICGRPYLTQREADLCTPREHWSSLYGIDTSDPFYYLRETDDWDTW